MLVGFLFGGEVFLAYESNLRDIFHHFEPIKTCPVHGESGGSILGSSAALGCPFMPDLLYKLRLDHIL